MTVCTSLRMQIKHLGQASRNGWLGAKCDLSARQGPCVCARSVFEDDAVAELLTTGKLSELACLTLYMMYEKKEGRKSRWYHYIKELDKQRARGQQVSPPPTPPTPAPARCAGWERQSDPSRTPNQAVQDQSGAKGRSGRSRAAQSLLPVARAGAGYQMSQRGAVSGGAPLA